MRNKKNVLEGIRQYDNKRIATCYNNSPKNNFSIDLLSLSTKEFKDINLRPSTRKDVKLSNNQFEEKISSKEAKIRIQKFLKSNSIQYETKTKVNSPCLKNSSHFLSNEYKKYMNLVNKKKSNGKITPPVSDKTPSGTNHAPQGFLKSKILAITKDGNKVSISDLKKKSQVSLERTEHSQNKHKKNLLCKESKQSYNKLFNMGYTTPNGSIGKSIERNKSNDKRAELLNLSKKNSREVQKEVYGLTEKLKDQRISLTNKKIKMNNQSSCDIRTSEMRLSSKEKLTETEKKMGRDNGKKILKNNTSTKPNEKNKPRLNLSRNHGLQKNYNTDDNGNMLSDFKLKSRKYESDTYEDKYLYYKNIGITNNSFEESGNESQNFINPLEINKKLSFTKNPENHQNEHYKKTKQITELNGILKNIDSRDHNQSISSIKDNKKVFPKTANNLSLNNSVHKSVEFSFVNSKTKLDNRVNYNYNNSQQIQSSNNENLSKSCINEIPKLKKQTKFNMNDVNSSIQSFHSVETGSTKKKKGVIDLKVQSTQKSSKIANQSTIFSETKKRKLPPKRKKSSEKKRKRQKNPNGEFNIDANPVYNSNDISIRDISFADNTEQLAHSEVIYDTNFRSLKNDMKKISESVNYGNNEDPSTIRRLLDDDKVLELYEKSFSEIERFLEYDKYSQEEEINIQLDRELNGNFPHFNIDAFNSVGDIQINDKKVSLI